MKEIGYELIPSDEFYELKAMVKKLCSDVEKITEGYGNERMSPKQVCAEINISRETYRKIVKNGIIKEIQPGGKRKRIYVLRSDLEAAMKEGKI